MNRVELSFNQQNFEGGNKMFLRVFLTSLFLSSNIALAQTDKEDQIRLFFLDINLESQVYGMFDAFSEMIQATLEKEEIDPEAASEIIEILREPESIKLFLEMAVPTYDKYFTYDEIIDLRRFFNSNTGKKFVSMTPLLSQELATVGEEWGFMVIYAYLENLLENY